MSFLACWLHHYRAKTLTVLPSPSSLVHNSDCELSLRRIFNIILFSLKIKVDIEPCDVSMVPSTVCFTLLLFDHVTVQLHLHDTSR